MFRRQCLQRRRELLGRRVRGWDSALVDDGNPCTTDSCVPATGVQHVPATVGTPCGDGNACDGEETCNASAACVEGTPLPVDDGNPCTTDSCDPATGVQHVAVAAGTSCADENLCNGAETCDASAHCLTGIPLVVDDGNPCTADSCDPTAGVVHVALPAGTSCPDGNACNGAETCTTSAVCVAGTPPVLDDGNPCTTDLCDPASGVSHTAVAAGTPCPDANVCNGAEICNSSGACIEGSPLVVDDGNPCTADSCDPPSGVQHTPVPAGTSCSDSNACNGVESCNASGECTPGTPPTLDDGNLCTTDACNPATGVTHTAVAGGTPCPDGNACNGSETCNVSATCVAGTAPVLDDGNPCTIDSCDPANGVSHTPATAGTPCPDSNACNGTETCDGSGACASGTPPVVDDGNPCTTDSCDPASGVSHTPVIAGTACPDGNACNGDETCNGSAICVAGTSPVLDDGNPCTTDNCNPASGVSHTPATAGTPCPDSNACNGAETCDGSGACASGTPPVVDDGNPCTVDSCDPATGIQHAAAPAGTSCSDGNLCDGDEVCDVGGTCVPGTPLVVDDGNMCTADQCDPTEGVTHTPVAPGTACGDNNVCTGIEACGANGQCLQGNPPVVDDQNPCTTDSCNPVTGVQHAVRPYGSSCSDGNACNGAEVCNSGGTCMAGTPPTITDDGNPCTADQCDPATGSTIHPPVAAGVGCGNELECDGTGQCVRWRESVPVLSPPPLPTVGQTSPSDIAAFLYSGTDPVQTGVQAQAVTQERVAVIQGRVLDAEGNALPSVRVSIAGQSQYGQTYTRADGRFDIAVNGGQTMVVRFYRTGLLPADRSVTLHWQEFQAVDDVVLLPQSENVTQIGLGVPELQVAVGSPSSDSSGQRTATLLFPANTTASLRMADGTTQPVTELHVRATEYTVGPNGKKAMPALLPATSAYTYAVELGADEATAAGAVSVDFSQAVAFYLENFLQFPVGERVPTGYYDRQRRAWIASQNGVVLRVLDASGGVAQVDVDGDGVADVQTVLDGLGITEQERQALAARYAAGTTLWRVPMTHFSPWDCNWPKGPPLASGGIDPSDPPPAPSDARPIPDPCGKAGCIIGVENQSVTETVALAGTPISLTYANERVPGHVSTRTLSVPITGSAVHPDLRRVELDVTIAGQSQHLEFGPAPNQVYSLVWDGRDGYGRPVSGRQQAKVTVTSVFPAVYLDAERFGEFSRTSASVIQADRARDEIRFPYSYDLEVNTSRVPTAMGLGGWLITEQHQYNAKANTLYLGNGALARASSLPTNISSVLGGLGKPSAVHTLPNGDVVIGLNSERRVKRYSKATGTLTTIAGNGTTTGLWDNVIATQGRVDGPFGLSSDQFGNIYLADTNQWVVTKVDTQGMMRVVAGFVNSPRGTDCSSLDYDPASEGAVARGAMLCYPYDVVVDREGAVYIADWGFARVRKVSTDGTLRTVAGNGLSGLAPISGIARDYALSKPAGVELDTQGNIYISVPNTYAYTPTHGAILRVDPSGWIRQVAGRRGECSTIQSSYDDGPAGDACMRPWAISLNRVGELLFVDSFAGTFGGITFTQRLRKLTPDGMVVTLALSTASGTTTLPAGSKAFGMSFGTLVSVGTDEKAAALVADSKHNALYWITLPVPKTSTACASEVPSPDGSEIYCFDVHGTHLQTRVALTGAIKHEFIYDSQGRLTTIRHGTLGNLETHVERDAGGNLVAIVGPYGHRTEFTVDVNGYLSSIHSPDGSVRTYTHGSTGLLQSYGVSGKPQTVLGYDLAGLLTSEQDPDGVSQTFTGTRLRNDVEVVRQTSAGTVESYRSSRSPFGYFVREVTAADGTVSSTVTDPEAGTATTATPDGMVTDRELAPDTVLGGLTTVPARTIQRTPGGVTRTTRAGKSATFSGGSVASVQWTTEINGRSQTDVYVVDSTNGGGMHTLTSPSGRTAIRVIDRSGRTIRSEVPGLLPIIAEYDANGRVTVVRQGSRESSLSYHATVDVQNGYASALLDPLGNTLSFVRDAYGRPLRSSMGDATVEVAFDELGMAIGVTPPGRPQHTQVFTPGGRLSVYQPPPAGLTSANTTYGYDPGGRLSTKTNPDGVVLSTTYSTLGRPDVISWTGATGVTSGQVQAGYYPPSAVGGGAAGGRLQALDGPAGVRLNFEYDGVLSRAVQWTGAVSGKLAWTYDADFRPTTETVVWSTADSSTVAFGYDTDGMLTCVSPSTCSPVGAGALVLTRDVQNGALTGTTLGAVTDSYTFNAYGEVATYTAMHGSAGLYSMTLDSSAAPRDGLGRIVQKTETTPDGTHVHGYSYDAMGRLTDVVRDGTLIEHYGYDLNGNRTSATLAGTTLGASYDDQDRLLTYGSRTYTYTANGDLLSTTGPDGTTTYTRDALGSLRTVQLGDGRITEYVVDALGRRVGKRVDGVLVRRWLYRDSLKPAAELDGAGVLVARFVYGSKSNMPDFVIRGSSTYRVISDQLGSPVLAVNVANASDVPFRATYEAFGKVTGTGLDWMPFGFAGGHYDVDTGLVRFGARDYDPETGRWTAKDPIRWDGGQANLYVYALANPINLADVRGANVCVYRSSVDYHHAWVEIGGDPARSYGFWPPRGLFGGPGLVQNPDPRWRERNSPWTEVACHYSTMNEDDDLERWINTAYDVNSASDRWPYFLGIYDCRAFAGDVLDQLVRLQGSPWPLGHDIYWTLQ